ncbi:caspase domain-containing protein [Armillaria nabsnona]|nr:caspase domain-containing protein [Armillaria nabsnona]
MDGPDIDSDGTPQVKKAMPKEDPRYNEFVMLLHELYHTRVRLASDKESGIEDGRPTEEDIFSQARKSGELPDASRFWALIIGIDKYDSEPLKGCVNDGKLMKEYLIKDLRVPEDHVRALFNESATRGNIINALLGFGTDQRILRDDIIIIYFAGHGSSYPDPRHLSDGFDHAIEAICSIDRGTDRNGRTVPDISDRELNSILSLISRVKSHRITAILDCCHSGSHSRCSATETTERIRTASPLTRDSANDMLRVADENMKHYPDYRSVFDSNWHPDMGSHVILTAARDYEYAREAKGDNGFHGVFTHSLLQTLRSQNLPERSTYIDLLLTLPATSYQTPVLAGRRMDTRIWYQD